MGKARIVGGPTPESRAAARDWQMKRFGRSTVEESPVKEEAPLPGTYDVSVSFVHKRDGKKDMKLQSVELFEGEGVEELHQRARAEASSIGLHNFGMDTYYKDYPDGHPVIFTLTHPSGAELSFVQNYDGNGYPSRERNQ